jgi:type II secretory pathway component GspD/PulD (secretin)
MRHLATAALLVSVASAQSPAENVDRLLRFVHTEQTESVLEIATAVRYISDLRPVSVDRTQRTLTLRGTASQVALAEWLFNELDQPVNRQTAAHDSVAHEYHLSGIADDVVRVFYLANAQTSQQFQEVAVMVRTMADIRRLFTYNAPRAIALRGTAGQVAFADWLIHKLDRNAMAQPADEYRLPADYEENVARVFYLANAETPYDLQQIATLVRSMADTRRISTYSSPKAMTVRGTPTQIALAEWLVKALDMTESQRANAQFAAHDYRPTGNGDDVVRVFYLNRAATAERLQEIATQVRSMTEAQRLFTYTTPRALAIRGTADQIALADRLIKERDR